MTRETEPDWDRALLEDVKAECENRFGKVEQIVVERDSKVFSFHRVLSNPLLILRPQGEIYLQFEDLKAAKGALANLNGRWFGGHQISASYISDAIMKAHT